MRDVFLSVRAAGLKVGTHYAVRTTRMHGPRKKQLSYAMIFRLYGPCGRLLLIGFVDVGPMR